MTATFCCCDRMPEKNNVRRRDFVGFMVSEVISPGCFGAGLRQDIMVIEACD